MKKTNKKLNIVAVTACPTGIAHTMMAAESLEKFAKKNGHKIQVEKQASHGILNKLTQANIDNADYVIIAAGKAIENKDRFNGKKVLEVKVAEPIKNCKKVFESLAMNAKVQNYGKKASNAEPSDKVSVMDALMQGLSYMIPVVCTGGIIIAIALGIGRMVLGGDIFAAFTNNQPGSSIWISLFHIGLAGLQLMVVVFGGYVAYAIGGRVALAPAMILSWLAQGITSGGTNMAFFNYSTGKFGVAGANLGIFGAVLVGLTVGYTIRWWNNNISEKIPKAIKTIEPIIIVPILWVLVGWIILGFALYIPLYKMSIGMQAFIQGLVSKNLLWIAGAIGGAMLCFDMGGPVNKIAFGTGVALITTNPEFMGSIAAAGAVAPFGSAFGWWIGKKIFKMKAFNENIGAESFTPAVFMGFLGISEGAIPFAIKWPKSAIISNVIGGAVAGGISGAFLITDVAAHTGPIVYFLGAIGRNGVTDFTYGLFYLIAIAIGSAVAALLFIALTKIMYKSK